MSLESLLQEQNVAAEAVKELKGKGVTGDGLTDALQALKTVKAKILPILQQQYDAEQDEEKKDALATKLRGYMDKKAQKTFDKQRKKAKNEKLKAKEDAAPAGGEKKLSKKELAKLEKKRKKQAAIAAARAKKAAGGAAEANATGQQGEKKGGSKKAAPARAVNFSFADSSGADPLPLVSFIAAELEGTNKPAFEATFESAEQQPVFTDTTAEPVKVEGDAAIARVLAPSLYPADSKASIDGLVALAQALSAKADDAALAAALGVLNAYLETRTFLGDNAVGFTIADLAMFAALEGKNIGLAKDLHNSAPHVVRWYGMCRAHKTFSSARGRLSNIAKRARLKHAANAKTDNYQELEGAVMGKVVTRFPPEPSGYLHIGHVKAALLNQFYAKKYKGKMIVRFDDTNPSKEKAEFEESILQDLETIGVKPDKMSHTSDFFPKIQDLARKLIKQGDAYMDDTPQEQMQHERMNRINSVHRDQSAKEALKLFEDLLLGKPSAQKFCLRARMEMQSDNATLRDPVFFRYNALPHHKTGTKYKAYPTYDFACPIVDSLEGVTHALRTNEYNQRIPQNMWVVDKLKLRKYRIQEFGRLNFEYTLMSKRKLTQLVANGEVEGWDDARFPTVRGMLRRGVQLPVLTEFILSQGFSQRLVTMQWDKYWSTNKKYLEPRARRFMAIAERNAVTLRLTNVPDGLVSMRTQVHPKDPSLGFRPFLLSNELYVEQSDAATIKEGEEVTLMQWGNAVIKEIKRDPATGLVTEMVGESNPTGNIKATRLKMCFVAKSPDCVPLDMVSFDFLINKPKMEEDDELADVLTSNDHPTRVATRMIGEPALCQVKQHQIVQIMRRGMTRCDKPVAVTGADAGQTVLQLFVIPDGKTKAMSAMATTNEKIARR